MTPLTTAPDPSIAQRRAADPAASVWVGASAGTGKTKVLTDRVLALLATGTEPQRLLCLTFTKAAAAEMANRVAAALGKWALASDRELEKALSDLLGEAPEPDRIAMARTLFAKVLETPGGMNIQTIHAFCQALLKRFPLEAGLSPHFQVMEERDARNVLHGALEDSLRAAQNGAGPLGAALDQVSARIREDEFTDLMNSVAGMRSRLIRALRQHGGVTAMITATAARLGIDPDDTEADVIAAGCADTAMDILGLRLAVAALEQGGKTDRDRAAVLAAWLAAPVAQRGDTIDLYAKAFLTDKAEPRKTLITQKATAKVPGAVEILDNEAERMVRLAGRRRAVRTLEATAALLTLSGAMMTAYGDHKTRRALMDFDDLILAARNLLSPEMASWVLYKLDGGIDHVLIDEAQDSNPDQWRVVESLVAEYFAGAGTRETPRTVFAVGDAKQSIYSFQGAQPDEFERLRDVFADRVSAAGETWRPVTLNVSFRSTPAVLRAVDAVFAVPEAAAGVALDGLAITHDVWRAGQGGRVELWPPVVPRGGEGPAPWKPPVERIRADAPATRLAALLAERIARMTGAAGSVPDILASHGRSVRPGDIMVLVRRRGGFVEDLVRELKSRKVRVAGVDRMVLSEQLAIMDLVALGRCLLMPDDDLTLATVLKSPLIGLDEDQLFSLAWKRAGSLWAALRDAAADDPAVAAAYATLRGLLAQVDYLPPFEFYSHVLAVTGGRRKILARLGPDAEDPLDEFLDLALGFERNHAPSLEGFLHWFAQDDVEIKRDLEQGRADAVRVMTVHGSKGLQAPVVILPDTMGKPRAAPRLLWADDCLIWAPRTADMDAVGRTARDTWKARQDEEYRRLLYVAMTRAEDRLIVCGWQGVQRPPAGCWYDLVTTGLQDIAATVEDPFLSEMAQTDSPDVLVLDARQMAEPDKRETTAGDAASFSDPGAWTRHPAPPESTPSKPLTPSRPDPDPAVRSPLGAVNDQIFRRGRLVHRLLESLPDMAPDRRQPAAARWLARSAADWPVSARDDLINETLAILDNPDFAPLFGAGSMPEVSLVGNIDGRVVSGQVDRLVVTPDAVWIVDYKTNRPPPPTVAGVAPVYLRQMAIYRAVLRRIYPGRRVRCALLWTDGPRMMFLPPTVLDGSLAVDALDADDSST